VEKGSSGSVKEKGRLRDSCIAWRMKTAQTQLTRAKLVAAESRHVGINGKGKKWITKERGVGYEWHAAKARPR